ALKLMLKPLGLTYTVQDEVLLITSPQANLGSTITRTYPVADLVIPPRHGHPTDALGASTAPLDPNNLQAQAAAMAAGTGHPVPAASAPPSRSGRSSPTS